MEGRTIARNTVDDRGNNGGGYLGRIESTEEVVPLLLLVCFTEFTISTVVAATVTLCVRVGLSRCACVHVPVCICVFASLRVRRPCIRTRTCVYLVCSSLRSIFNCINTRCA